MRNIYGYKKLNDMLAVRNFEKKPQWVCAGKNRMLTGVNVCFTLSNKQLVVTECPTMENQNECGDYIYFPTTPEEKKGEKCAF